MLSQTKYFVLYLLRVFDNTISLRGLDIFAQHLNTFWYTYNDTKETALILAFKFPHAWGEGEIFVDLSDHSIYARVVCLRERFLDPLSTPSFVHD